MVFRPNGPLNARAQAAAEISAALADLQVSE
jgi:hypothetical protein